MGQIKLLPSANWGMREWALMYAGIGWKVFPVYEVSEKGVCCCAEGNECPRPGKHPRTAGGVNEASAERVAVEAWWVRWPAASIGIATGRASNLTVIDADASGGKPGVVNLSTLTAKHGGIPATLIVNTGGGGLHLYFTYSDALRTGTNVLGEAIDIRNDGGYAIAPPSRHASGRLYTWREADGDLLPLPAWATAPGHDLGARKRSARGPKRPAIRLDRVEEMLRHIDPEDRDRWLAVGVILGRAFFGTEDEAEAWHQYETWAARSGKFDADRAGCIARMREMFYEQSQETPRAGAQAGLSAGSLTHWARAGGWDPWGGRVAVAYEPGNELGMAEELVRAMLELKDNRFFSVMGEVRDVLSAPVPSVRLLSAAAAEGTPPPQTLVVRRTSTPGMQAGMMRAGVLRTVSRDGAAVGMQIPLGIAQLALVELAGLFPPLAGVVSWPLVSEGGELLMEPRGYSARTGLYFDIAEGLELKADMKLGAAWKILRSELLGDFPFDDAEAEAAALGMMVAFMERPLMKTCPAFSVVAPQAGTGKSTLVEVASLAVHGAPVASHAWSLESEELRKAIHSLLLAKIPAVNFDNITRGSAVDSDHLAKLLTTELSTDRTLGASETRKELNTLLVTFTGNNIAFARDLASRVINVKLNARTGDPLHRAFRSADIRRTALNDRSRWLSALITIVRAGARTKLPEGAVASRFEDFDLLVARAVYAATAVDIRGMLSAENEVDAEADATQRDMLVLLWRWQEKMRAKANGTAWRTGEFVSAVEGKVLTDDAIRIVTRSIGNTKAWETDPARAFSYALRALNGSYRGAPMVLQSQLDKASRTNLWLIKGGPKDDAEGGF